MDVRVLASSLFRHQWIIIEKMIVYFSWTWTLSHDSCRCVIIFTIMDAVCVTNTKYSYLLEIYMNIMVLCILPSYTVLYNLVYHKEVNTESWERFFSPSNFSPSHTHTKKKRSKKRCRVSDSESDRGGGGKGKRMKSSKKKHHRHRDDISDSEAEGSLGVQEGVMVIVIATTPVRMNQREVKNRERNWSLAEGRVITIGTMSRRKGDWKEN